MNEGTGFPARLVRWRRSRGLSQLQLALSAGCSQRHVGFLELGRTRPSRDMVLRLAEVLDIPLRQSNDLLLAAGFAPVWRESALDDTSLAPVNRALDHILTQQEPFPAVVVDRRWKLLRANRAAVRFVEFLVGPLEPGAPVNLADALAAPDILKPYLTNWNEVVAYFVRTVEADALADGTTETADLLSRLMTYPGVEGAASDLLLGGTEGPVLPMYFEKDRTRFALFTTIATLGTPKDITLQELRIESFFPMDEATREVFSAWEA